MRLNVIGSLFNQRVQFGQHYRFLTASASMAGLATDFATQIVPDIQAAVSASVTLSALEVSDTSPTGAESVEHQLAGGTVGSIAGEALPPQDAIVVSLHTGFKGRRKRGRFYLPGLAEANVASGRVSGAQLAAIEALAGAMTGRYGAAGTSADYRMVVHSPEDLTATPPRPGTLNTDVTSTTVDDVVRTQRRRQLGVGA